MPFGQYSSGSAVAFSLAATSPLVGTAFALGAVVGVLRTRRVVVHASRRGVDDEVVDRVFDRLDVDSNGVVDQGELRKGLALVLGDRKLKDEELQKMMRVFDENFDGVIQRKEWRDGAAKAAALWQSLHPDNGDLFEDLSVATMAELEVEYVDATFRFFNGDPIISDEEYAALKEELTWQGSVFPSLNRDELKWLEAELAYYRGEPIMPDAEFEELAAKVAAGGKRTEMTAFLYFVKGKTELSDEQYRDEELRNSMNALGITVGRKGAAGPMVEDSADLVELVDQQALFLASLGFFPLLVCCLTSGLVLATAFGWGTAFQLWPLTLGVGLGGAALLTQQLLVFLDLQDCVVLGSTCPACGSSQNHFLGGSQPELVYRHKCTSCSHEVQIDLGRRRSAPVGVPEVVAAGLVGRRSWSTSTARAGSTACRAADVDVMEKPNAPMPPAATAKTTAPSKAPIKPKPSKKKPPFSEQAAEGIFAVPVLFGYWLLGQKFVETVRGKGIAKHSQAITSFCARFGIRKQKNQGFIKTAKATGHDLGFLVPGGLSEKDGLFGKEAMQWWKESGLAKW